MEFALKDILYIFGIIISGIVVFFKTKHGIKEYVRDHIDNTTKEITSLKLQIKDLQNKDELQQQVIDQIGNNNNALIPVLVEALKQKQQVNG